MPSHFELCIKVNTLAHAQRRRAQPHTSTAGFLWSRNHSSVFNSCFIGQTEEVTLMVSFC